jgi:hypothetical protein
MMETDRDRFFIQKDAGKIYPLENITNYYVWDNHKMKWVRSKEKTIMKTNEYEEYKGVLKYIYSDYPELYPSTEKSILVKKNMIELAQDYQNKVCPGSECIVYEKLSKTTFNIGAGVAYFYETIKGDYDLGNNRLILSSFPEVFINSSVRLHALNERSEIRFLFLRTSFLFEQADDRYTYSLSGKHWFIPVMYQYNLTQNRLQPYLSAGAFFNKWSEIHASRKSIFSDSSIPISNLAEKYKGIYVGPMVSLGMSYYFINYFFFNASLNAFIGFLDRKDLRGYSAQASIGLHF